MGEQGTEYGKFIQNELNFEHERRDTVNSRAATAVTSATGLVTVTLAVVAVLKGQHFTFHGASLVLLAIGLLAFLISGVLAVLAGLNWRYDVASIDALRQMSTDRWIDRETTARSLIAQCNVHTINSLRAGNNIKFIFLLAAGFAQIAAILALSFSVLVVVI
jgi:hypothetical protein